MSVIAKVQPVQIKKWVALVKPGIVMGNTVAASAGFFTAAIMGGFSLLLLHA